MKIEHHILESFDGTRIAYQTVGSHESPVIVLANGLGGNIITWTHIIDHFADRYRFVSWDYRGIFDSEVPGDRETLKVPQQCRDLELILSREGVQEAIFLGWSMGVQVNFEFYRRHAGLFKGLVLVNGTYGSPFDTAFGLTLTRYLLPGLSRILGKQGKLLSRGVRLVQVYPRLIELLKAARLLAPTVDESIFFEMVDHYAGLDFECYFETLKVLGDHDAFDVLSTITCPTLIIAGQNDPFTPRSCSLLMEHEIHNSTLVIVPMATHYIPIEFPEQVNIRLSTFFDSI